MSPDGLASLLKARRAGRMKWVARCPAHDDRSPSLSISEGHGGRILLKCFAGCSTEAVLEKLGLTWSDLFIGSRGSRCSVRTIQHRRAVEESRRREWHKTHSALCNRALHFERLIEELGKRLVMECEGSEIGDQLSTLFHQALEKLRQTERDLEVLEKTWKCR